MRKYISIVLLLVSECFHSSYSRAQAIDTVATYSLSAYIDAYGASYTDQVGYGNFQKFPTVSPRNNEVGLNTFQLAARYEGDRIRAIATLHVGDIAQSSWSRTYPLIQEAHIGFRILKNLWIDAGFFRTHFGTEFLLPVENITSSVAIATYYEPYYESGVRLNFDPTKRLEINIFLLNGYGIYEENNKRKSFGAGVTYSVSDYIGIGYTNYIGNDAPDSIAVSQLRIAQNIFINYQRNKWKVQVGADLYLQQHADINNSNSSATAYSALATISYHITPAFSVYARGEIFNDQNGYLSGIITDVKGKQTGYKLWGATAGLEYKPTDNSYIRLEGRKLQMDNDQEIFRYNEENRNYRYEVMVNAGISFSLLKGIQTRN
ncbi:MAG: outer membrane beta-barrel protein [Taibaiella sp.]|nr:outer membrane beta-barrel protein [Taibaiella sp.]